MQTKINTSYTVQIFIFNTIIFVLFLGYSIFSILPQFSEIQEKKSFLQENTLILQRIEKEGMNFQEFKDQKSQNSEQNEYLQSIVKIISPSFYSSNIRNTSPSQDFNTFIEKEAQKLQAMKKEASFQERLQKLDTILPSYNESFNQGGAKNLTDFRFINSVESMLYAFNLSSDDPVGIGEVLPVKEYSSKNSQTLENNQNSLDTNLFYIPLRLSLSGRKSDIIDFFHYVENIWTIKIENKEVSFFQDKVLNRSIPWFSGANLYETQIFDIESLEINEYLDSSIDPSNLPDMIEFIKKTQGNEKLDFDITLRFYVKWLPDYQIKKYIKDTLTLYDSLLKWVDAKIKESTLKKIPSESDEILIVSNLRSMLYDLQGLETDIKTIRQSLVKSTTIQDSYKKSLGFSQKLNLLKIRFETMSKKLDIILRK
jgi:hypothetical protein